MCLSIVIYTPICLRKKSMACFCTPMSLWNIFSLFTKLEKRIKSHWDEIDTSHVKEAQKTESHGTSWLAEKTGSGRSLTSPTAVGPWVWKYQVAWPSPRPTHHVWQRTGLEKWTQCYNYVQWFGIADLIPFDVFYIWQMFTFASQRTQSYPRHTH